MNDLQSTFLIISASFSSTSCCFSSGITWKSLLFSLRLHVCVAVFILEKENWQCSPPPPFCHATVHHACIPGEVHCLMYHDQDTFDFSQGHVTKNQTMAVPVKLSESRRNITVLFKWMSYFLHSIRQQDTLNVFVDNRNFRLRKGDQSQLTEERSFSCTQVTKRFRVTFTANWKRKFVPHDQVFS